MDIEVLLDVAHRRRAIRKYLPDPVSDEQVDKVIEVARWAPSGANTQPWEFVVVRNRDTILELAKLWMEMYEQTLEKDPTFLPTPREYLKNIPVLILVLADTRCRRVFPRLDTETPTVIFHHTMGAVIQNMQLAAAALGLGTTWLSIHPHVEREIRKLLDIPPVLEVAAGIPLGYPVKVHEGQRRDQARMVHHEKYDASKLRDAAAFEGYLPGPRAKRAME
ncbi:MAG: nitroreductase family protein [Chloroflexi bacterium]|nr:nitroreductase family protein [Chloroflexota bacterium]